MAVMTFGVTPINKLTRNAHDNQYVHKLTSYNAGDPLSKVSGAGNYMSSGAAVKIWGQTFDGTHDITGDLSDANNITASGRVRANIFYQNGNPVLDNDNSEVAENYVKIYNTTKYFLSTDEFGNVNRDLHIDGDLFVNGDGTFEGDVNLQGLEAQSIHTHELTADIAHFFELQIDKIKAVGGTVIITPANFKVDLVEEIEGGYRCYQACKDDTRNKAADDLWDDGDQAICASFNASEGTSFDVSNKFYWCAVTAHGRIQKDDVWYLYIDLSTSDKDEACTVNPEVGDEIVQLGNKTNTARQNAIILSAYKSPDSGVTAPSIAQYKGINDYTLSSHRTTVISPSGNIFRGEFHIETGENIEDLINGGGGGGEGQGGEGTGTTPYVHFAWADDANGTGFTKDPAQADGKYYLGVCTNNSEDETNLVWTDYTWMRIKGEPGDPGQPGQATGVNACHLDFDNENDTVLATPDGTIVQSTLPTTNLLFFDGNDVVTMLESAMTVTAKGCTYTKSSYVYGGVNKGFTFKITDVTTADFSLTVEYLYNGTYYRAVFNGKRLVGTIKWEIITTPTVVRKKTDGTLSSNSIKVDIYKTDTQGVRKRDTTINASDKRIRYYIGGSSTAKYLSAGGSIPSTEFADSNAVTIELYDQNNVICDKETVCIIADGTDGKNVSQVTTYYQAFEQEGTYTRTQGTWTEWVSKSGWSKEKRYLYAYQYWFFTDHTETYSSVYLASVWGQDGDNTAQDGKPGADAEFFMLVPLKRNAVVTKRDVLTIDFQYNIFHVKGEVVEKVANIQNEGFKAKFKSDDNTGSTYENWTYSGDTISYSNSEFATNYHKSSNPPTGFFISLTNSEGTVFDTDHVKVVFDAGAALDIADDIRSYVQDVEGNLSTISQKANEIEARVNDVEGDYSQIKQQVDNINIGVQRSQGLNLMTGIGTGEGWTMPTDEERGKFEFEADNAFGYYTFTITNYGYVDGTYTDVNLASPIIGVEPNQTYTLSFWFKPLGCAASDFNYYLEEGTTASKVRSWVQVFGSENKNVGFSNTELASLPSTVIYLNNHQVMYDESGYYRYTATFNTSTYSGRYAANYIRLLFHNRTHPAKVQGETDDGTSVINIRNVQIEKGDTATAFAVDKAYSESLINSTADSISLRVKNAFESTGIDIETGQITLDATKTKVMGNLEIHESESGMTVFDDSGNPRINVVPELIGDYDHFDAGTQTYINASGYNYSPKYSVTTDKVAIGNLTAGTNCTMGPFTIFIHSNPGTIGAESHWPTTYSIKLEVILTRQGNSSWSTTQSFNASKVQYSQYRMTSNYTFNPPTNDVYYVQFKVSNDETPPSQYYKQMLSVNAKWAFYTTSQTTIGLDGFMSHPDVNKVLWVSRDNMVMQHGIEATRGIRIDDKGLRINTGPGYATAAMDSSKMSPRWLPIWNFTPIFSIGSVPRVYTSTYITPANGNRWAYRINPWQDAGICLPGPHWNDKGGTDEVWILLPETSYTDEFGIRQSLPTGYTVTIINPQHDREDNPYEVYVGAQPGTGTVWLEGQQMSFIDANLNLNAYIRLSAALDQARDTFIWDGFYWLCMHDVQ